MSIPEKAAISCFHVSPLDYRSPLHVGPYIHYKKATLKYFCSLRAKLLQEVIQATFCFVTQLK